MQLKIATLFEKKIVLFKEYAYTNTVMSTIQHIKNTLQNISDAVHGSYVAKDENGIPYCEIYKKTVPLVGKRGMREDKKNLARDMNRSIQRYDQKKK